MEKDELQQSELFSISDEPAKTSQFGSILYNKAIVVEQDSLQADDASFKLKSTVKCFNCGNDGHRLGECTEPYNQIRIARNRAKMLNRGVKTTEFTRYHKEIDDRFSDFRPGVLSSKLKEALGLKKDTLPRHIYNMRRLGYPPGWLEEAKISHSGINMLDSNGERVPDPDEEEGEICTVRVKYDATKIIDYPGFNVWPDPGTINETEIYASLPMCYDHCKEALIGRLNDSTYVFENIIDVDESPEIPFRSEIEMDVENLEDDSIRFDDEKSKFGFIPPLPDDSLPTPLPPPPPTETPPSPTHSGENEDIVLVNSSDEEGELPSKSSQKSLRKKPVKRLSATRSDSSDQEQSKLSVAKEWDVKQDSSDDKLSPQSSSYPLPETPTNIDITNTDVTATPETSKIAQDTFGRIKSVELGTPVLNHSPFTALPAPEKFRKDISDVIYFENLPNSTGKYDRLKTILKNVRSKLNIIRGDVKK